MQPLATLVILTAVAAAPIEAAPGAAPSKTASPAALFHAGFEADADQDFDGWPDGWLRQRGPKYPPYVKVGISQEATPSGKQCLRMDLDGGGAAVDSAVIAIDPSHAYLVEVDVKTEHLVHDEAFVTLSFLGADRKVFETVASQRVGGTSDWTKLRIGPIASRHDEVRYAVVGLHFEPGEKQDLRGAALFDSVRFGRTPRVVVRSGNPFNVLSAGEPVTIRCEASGLSSPVTKATIRIEDADGALVAETVQQLKPGAAATTHAPETASTLTSTSWETGIREPGFYRVHVRLQGYDGPLYDYGLAFVVVEPAARGESGEFGWCVPDADASVSLATLNRLAQLGEVHWLKMPLWSPGNDRRRVDALLSFADELSASQVHLVGLIANPPPEVAKQLPGGSAADAGAFAGADPKLWYPAIEPVMARMALKVRWWQLGHDDDDSLVGDPNLVRKVARVKEQLDRIGLDVRFGLGWDWLDEAPAAAGMPWRFLARSANPPLTSSELSAYMAVNAPRDSLQWVTLEPLPQGEYSAQSRARDLVERMIVAKIGGAAAVFASDPFHPRTGLMNDDGSAGELFLPWVIAARALSGTEHLGSMQLPAGSTNHVFVREGRVSMVVWNALLSEEKIYLGDQIRQHDLWGRRVAIRQDGASDVVKVGPQPTFVEGLDPAIIRWRMDLAMERPVLPEVFGEPHAESLRVKNTFDRGVTVRGRIVAPAGWRIEPDTFSLQLGPGEDARQAFTVALPDTADNGRQVVRIDFDVAADRRYEFSAYQSIQIGSGDVLLEAQTRENEDGDLEVVQTLVNNSNRPVSYRCYLYAPDRRRIRTDVADLPTGRDTKTYVLRGAADLVGATLWIRAEEVGGQRILNRRFVVTK